MPPSLAVATLQASALSMTSNILAQLFEAWRGQHALGLDVLQLLRFVVLCFITTPPNYLWQQLLERTFPAYPPAPEACLPAPLDVEKAAAAAGRGENWRGLRRLSRRNTLAKWFVDCITLGAVLNTAAFLVLMGMLKGQSAAQIRHSLRTEMIPIILAGYKFWPLASIVSFSFVPVERRIVFLNFIGLLWGVYLSLVAARV